MEKTLVIFAALCVALVTLLKNRVERYAALRTVPVTAGWSVPSARRRRR